jgi:RNA polymerase sigma-70 factor (ECF subfamily)
MSTAPDDGRAPKDGRAPDGGHSADSAEVALARAVVAREPWAEREVWERYSPMVHGVLRRALGPGHDFEDLLQDVFLRFYNRVQGLREPSALRSFIYSITIRVVRWEIRRAQSLRRREAAALELRDGPEMVTADPEARDLVARAQVVLDGLPPRERAVFVLRHVEGKELSEIAEGLEISLSTAKRWLKHAVALIDAGMHRDGRLSRMVKGRPTT